MAADGSFSAQVESRNGVTLLALRGELDMASVPTLNQHLADCGRDGAEVIMLDIRDLSFIDSTGLGAILAASDHSKRNGHRFLMVGANRPARRLLEITGTEYLIDEPDAVDVVDRFTGGRTGDPTGTVPTEPGPDG